MEGPHLYKRDGWYYLVCAEGGTSYEHAITCARSKNLFGPYEVHPANPLITSYGYDCKLKRAGHGSWCKSPDGKKIIWFIFADAPLKELSAVFLGAKLELQNLNGKKDGLG